jgi:glycosyltransferase involved in cell wall biosynthesis
MPIVTERLSGRHQPRDLVSANAALIILLGGSLVVRVLIDDRSAPDSRHTGTLNLSGLIALVYVLSAALLVLHRRRAVRPAAVALLWLCVWIAIAMNNHGASTETLREGVREISVVAVAVIVYNLRSTITVAKAARIVQFAGCVPAFLALYQFATHTGLDIAGDIRSNGTFAHPNSAAMFFAIAATASMWLYIERGRRWIDLTLTTFFAAALIATFSIDGLATLVAMLFTLGAMHPGSLRGRLEPCVLAAITAVVFIAIPLGSQRVAGETKTNLSAAERGETTSSLDTRLYRWKTLLPEWEQSPVFGQGLGTTTTAENTVTNKLNSLLPHNEYIRYLVETGVAGMLLLLLGLAAVVRALARRRKDSDPRVADASPLAIAVVVGCLFNSLADNTLLNSPTCYAAAMIVASVLALSRWDVRAAPARERVNHNLGAPAGGGEPVVAESTADAYSIHHFGPDAASVGGIATVIRIVVEHGVGGDGQVAHATWRPGARRETACLTGAAAAEILRLSRNAITHFHLSERGSFLREGSLLALGRARGLTTVATIHGADFAPFATRYPWLVSLVLRRAHLIMCLDANALDIARGAAPNVRSELVPNPAPAMGSSSPARNTDELVVFAGEISLRKGADILARAWPAVARSRPRARCLMVGPRADFDPPRTERLTVQSSLAPAEMRHVLLAARVVALPARAEGMPMVLTEAMSLGRPFVGTPVGAIPELADAGGMLVPVGDDAALADRLIELLSDPDLAQTIGERGRRFCERTRGIEVIDGRLRELYSAAFAARARRASTRRGGFASVLRRNE